MGMKRLFSKCLGAVLLAFFVMPCRAENSDTTTVVSARPAYEQRLERREERWKKLIPNMYIGQYAGGIGMFSVGVGWDYGRNNHWETHVMLGFLPKRYNRDSYFTFTLREVYVPWNVAVRGAVSLRPLTVSLAVNSIFHGDFWMSEPDRYPHGYYGFSSRMRFHLGLGQRVSVEIPRNKRYLSSYMTAYYEVSTCDLYVRQKILSSSIPLKDILVLGVGLIFTI